MNFKRWSYKAATTLFAAIFAASAWAGNTYKVLHAFGQGFDGWAPESGLVIDINGNLFGTTTAGGSGCRQSPGCGIVFELVPNGYGGWTEISIHNFNANDGAHPYATPVLDSRGNLYGTTYGNGFTNQGTVFKLSPSGGGWAEFVLHTFTGGWDGGNPEGSVLLDKSGHVYGTTTAGGTYNDGVVFDLGSQSIGAERVIDNLAGDNGGSDSTGTLVSDAKGNLYGTTYSGGINNSGTVFQLAPNKLSPGWNKSVLYSFSGASNGSSADGANPYAGLVFDGAGNLYGTTLFGGPTGSGTVFQLTPNPDESWTESIICGFQGGVDGNNPYAGVIFDPAGNLYGTTAGGGPGGYGTVFKLTPALGHVWKKSLLYGFTGREDGGWPGAGVVIDNLGNIYGTAAIGGRRGSDNGGVVWEITP